MADGSCESLVGGGVCPQFRAGGVCQPVAPEIVRTSRVSSDTAGGDLNGESASPSISADGRYVAFESVGTDLTVESQPGVFVHDRMAGTTVRVDHGVSPSISGDGRYLAYTAASASGRTDVFVRDLVIGSTTLASEGLGGGAAVGFNERPSISADGRHVTFISDASNLVLGDGNGPPDVFVRDLDANITVRAMVSVTGGDSAQAGYGASRYWETSSVLSADGRLVVFVSSAEDLVVDPVPGGGAGGNVFRPRPRGRCDRTRDRRSPRRGLRPPPSAPAGPRSATSRLRSAESTAATC